MISPVSLSENTTLVRTIKADEIIDLYKKVIGIDISYLKKITEDIKLYKCNESGYYFYSPANTAGDGSFYAELSKQSWYYSLTRWEHTKALELIPEQGKLLEMGCGSGYFLGLLKSHKQQLAITGLEINESAINEGRSKGLNIVKEDVVTHAKSNSGSYDIVCSFQVMEHIYDVREVLQAQIDLLKMGGSLLIGIPNNDSYVGKNKHISRCLNMPPHHMGLWSKELFRYIENEFSLKMTGVYEEPFSEDAYDICHYTDMVRMLRSEFLVKLWFKLKLPVLFKPYFLKKYKRNEPGHTILAHFRKEGME